jgi:GTP-binding protein
VERRRLTLIDTGGMDLDDEDPMAASIQEQARAALSDAEVALSWSTRAPACAPATRSSPICCAARTSPWSWRRTRSTRGDLPLAHEFLPGSARRAACVSAAQGALTG